MITLTIKDIQVEIQEVLSWAQLSDLFHISKVYQLI